MGRSVKPGISFYRMDVGHILNKKIRLLYNEFGSDGYYIWHALLDHGYGKWGYYFDMNDLDELELFASDFCKKKLATIQEVIAGCIRRDLFDQGVADKFGILTSDMMQETFLIATSDRRAKGSIFEMGEEWLLLDLSTEVPPNISVVPVKNRILPGKKGNLPGRNPQRREDKIRREKRREEENKPPAGGDGASAPPPSALEVFRGLEKSKKTLYQFIAAYKPDFIEPYVELWNFFAGQRGKAQISKISEARRKKFKTRIAEKAFDFVRILTKAGHAGDFLSTSKWFTWDWIMESEGNYLKVLEGNYDPDPKKGSAPGPAVGAKETEFLYQRYLENNFNSKLITEKHCDYLLQAGLIELDERFILQAVSQRIQTLTGTNQAAELRMIEAYQKGTWGTDPDCQADEPNRIRVAKKLALIAFFKQSKDLNRETITQAIAAEKA